MSLGFSFVLKFKKEREEKYPENIVRLTIKIKCKSLNFVVHILREINRKNERWFFWTFKVI